jgi:hypothetical protein
VIVRPVRLSLLTWYGVLGAPLAWAAAHVTGWLMTETACSPGGSRWSVSVDAWSLGLVVAAGVVAVGSWAAAIWAFRATREAGPELPWSRLHFLSIIGMTVGLLFTTLIVISGLGAFALQECVGS